LKKLQAIQKSKSLFLKWNLHKVVQPFSLGLKNAVFMADMSAWRNDHPVKGYNDFYQDTWEYSRRYNLYEAIVQQEGLTNAPIDYLEFGVAGGVSFKWWLQQNQHEASRFYGFDTFEGLPEDWGPFGKGTMAHSLESLQITDLRSTFYKGLFQHTLLPFLEGYKPGKRKLIHLDADLFSASIFVLTQLYRFLQPGDILLFDEFVVPQHEFLAFKIFTESFYVNYEVIGAANNYLFVAVKIV
jgi:hypothetical protein